MATVKGWVMTHPFTCEVVDGAHPAEGEPDRMTYQVKCTYTDEDGETRNITVPWTVHVTSTHWPDDSPWDILDDLVSNAWSIMQTRTFEEWAQEFDYDTDSRRAEQLWHQCRSHAALVRDLLGDDLVERLATKYERL